MYSGLKHTRKDGESGAAADGAVLVCSTAAEQAFIFRENFSYHQSADLLCWVKQRSKK